MILFSEPKFDLDLQLINRRYKDLQKVIHPDLFNNSEETEKGAAEELSTHVNEAYFTLRNEIQRANYLLKLQGEEVLEEGHSITDPLLIMEIMEVRENISMANSDEDLDKLRAENQTKKSELLREFQTYFSAKEVDEAKQTLVKLSYYSKILEEIQNREESLKEAFAEG
mmetsp:Transcript_30338/g.34464  ORF Transcript_30338/g.34464 Transcript_30338/m.34464 type:complete len:169 (+) Transcript_30338:608-1114(+)